MTLSTIWRVAGWGNSARVYRMLSDFRPRHMHFAALSQLSRAAHYREHAARMRELAADEKIGGFRERLLDIARQYDELVAMLESGG